jgi:hypothetical protein
MSKLIRLLSAVTLLGVAHGNAFSADSKCAFAEWGYSYIKVVEQGEDWTYVLKASGPKWKIEPYGYHAPGFLSCRNCSSPSDDAGGLYYFFAQSQLDSFPVRYPRTAAERVERHNEAFSYPPISLGPENLDHLASREGVRLGPLSGYAVAYRLTPRQSGSNASFADQLALRARELLVISLTDGCIAFETTIATRLSNDVSDWAHLDSLLKEVTIKRTPSGQAETETPVGAYSARVRRNEGEPRFLHQLKPSENK